MNVRSYVWQRGTAVLLFPMVITHLIVIFYATHKGLTASDILQRTRGSIAWGLFYGAFVFAAAIHASIGIRNIVVEWSPMKGVGANLFSGGFGLLLIVLGLRAIFAVVLA
jgi:fumarate reductase subunit C